MNEVDASTVRQQGADENQQRIHLCYSLNQNRIKQVKVTDHHTAESLTHFSMGKGDLIMADAGYGTARNYIYAQEQQADVILRITPRNFCLYDADGEKISLVSLLKKAEEQNQEMIDVFGFCRYRNKTGYVRVIAQKLPEHQSFLCERILKEKTERMETIYSTYENCMIAFIQIKTILCLPWGLFIDLADEKYFRYLSKQKRWRINQNEAFHTAILPGLLS